MKRQLIVTSVACALFAVACGGAQHDEAATPEEQGKGHLPPEAIQKVVRQGYPKLEDCYKKAQESNPEVQGRVGFSFTITAEGRVSKLDTSDSTLEDQTMLDCLATTFESFEFPKPEGGGVVTVKYPIIFSPDEPVTD